MKIKRVICFDLNGTLLKANNQLQTKDELLEEAGVSRSLASAVIRSVLMTNECFVQDLESIAKTRLLTYEESYGLLIRKLYQKGALPMAFDPEDFRQRFIRLWQQENQGLNILPRVEQILRELKDDLGNRLVLVSNISSLGVHEAKGQLDKLRPFFDLLYMSCNQQAAKPDPYVWEWVMNAFAGKGQYWMIGDDPVVDLAVPKALGWQTILVGIDAEGIGKVPEIISWNKA